MIKIRLIGTQREIRNTIKCLSADYRITYESKLYPVNRHAMRCYIIAVDQHECRMCSALTTENGQELCAKCLRDLEQADEELIAH